MTILFKFLSTPLLLLASCLIAGLYGAVHNQMSYTVSPDYFHAFKFEQFAIADDWRNRWGAAQVGVLASWWMGGIVGVPIIALGARIAGLARFVGSVLLAAAVVAAITLAVGMGALIWAYGVLTPETVPAWAQRPGFSSAEAVAFARAGTMHNASYAGALIGGICGLVLVTWRGRRRRNAKVLRGV